MNPEKQRRCVLVPTLDKNNQIRANIDIFCPSHFFFHIIKTFYHPKFKKRHWSGSWKKADYM